MSIKKGAAPATLPATLTVVGQGASDKLNVTYHNRKSSDIREKLDSGMSMLGLIPYLVSEWDTDFALTEEGVSEFEDEYPGIVQAIMQGYHEARHKRLEKN